MKRPGAVHSTLLAILLLLLVKAQAQEVHCDCDPSLLHFCRCGVLIEQDIADIQIGYLNRLIMAEFNDYLYKSPVTTVRVAPAHEMVLEGEATQGYFDNGEIVLNDTLTRDQALMVLAHELGHAWQFVAQPDPDEISNF